MNGGAVAAQSRVELPPDAARGESLLLTLGIPVVLLVFFSLVDGGLGRATAWTIGLDGQGRDDPFVPRRLAVELPPLRGRGSYGM